MTEPRSAAERGKRAAARRALDWVEAGTIVGVGTGSTVAYFIDALAGKNVRAVSSSVQSTRHLERVGIEVIDLAGAGDRLALYVDGADEVDPSDRLVKGGGGALTREKILAEVAAQFVCIVDADKRVEVLGRFPLPIEVIPMASGYLRERIGEETGGEVRLRTGFTTDNGNVILDVHGLHIDRPEALEAQLERLPGVVTVGLFARRKADRVLVGDAG